MFARRHVTLDAVGDPDHDVGAVICLELRLSVVDREPEQVPVVEVVVVGDHGRVDAEDGQRSRRDRPARGDAVDAQQRQARIDRSLGRGERTRRLGVVPLARERRRLSPIVIESGEAAVMAEPVGFGAPPSQPGLEQAAVVGLEDRVAHAFGDEVDGVEVEAAQPSAAARSSSSRARGGPCLRGCGWPSPRSDRLRTPRRPRPARFATPRAARSDAEPRATTTPSRRSRAPRHRPRPARWPPRRSRRLGTRVGSCGRWRLDSLDRGPRGSALPAA